MVGRESLVENFDLCAAVESLAGGHETRTAAAENDDVGFNVPLCGEFVLAARGMSERGSGRGGRSCGGAEEGAAGEILKRHGESHFMLILKLWQSLHSKRDSAWRLWQLVHCCSPR